MDRFWETARGHEASERAFAIQFAREGRFTPQAGMPESHTFGGVQNGACFVPPEVQTRPVLGGFEVFCVMLGYLFQDWLTYGMQ